MTDIAELLASAGLRVHDLEWRSPPDFHKTKYSDTILGEYAAWDTHYRRGGSNEGIAAGPTIEQSMAAAQADFTARILSTLSSGDAS